MNQTIPWAGTTDIDTPIVYRIIEVDIHWYTDEGIDLLLNINAMKKQRKENDAMIFFFKQGTRTK